MGLAALIAAPAIVHATSLMPVKAIKAIPDEEIALLRTRILEANAVMSNNIYSDGITAIDNSLLSQWKPGSDMWEAADQSARSAVLQIPLGSFRG